jgi:hypothetical protein
LFVCLLLAVLGTQDITLACQVLYLLSHSASVVFVLVVFRWSLTNYILLSRYVYRCLRHWPQSSSLNMVTLKRAFLFLQFEISETSLQSYLHVI